MPSRDEPEVKAPAFKVESASDDWRIHLYNQERMLVSQEQITDVLQRLLDQQKDIVEMAAKLDRTLDGMVHMTTDATKATAGFIQSVIKVPVAIAVIGISSWLFAYEKVIQERTWLIILAVSVFPWLGESLTAIFRIIRGSNGTNK